jgi:hypothetical protein
MKSTQSLFQLNSLSREIITHIAAMLIPINAIPKVLEIEMPFDILFMAAISFAGAGFSMMVSRAKRMIKFQPIQS